MSVTGEAVPGVVGALGAERAVLVDGRGGVRVEGTRLSWSWWVGAEDRWHRASVESAVRRQRLGVAPVYEVAMRVPSGDVVERVYALGGPGDPVVVEVENASPLPVALALVGNGVDAGADLTAPRARVARDVVLVAAKPAAHVVAAPDEAALLAALEHGATGPGPDARTGPVAVLTPLSHRTRARYVVALDPHALPAGFDPATAAGADAVARGWASVLGRGMRVVFADERRCAEVDRDRVDLLLAASRPDAGAVVFRALEEWGFDDEAVALWRRLGWRARRRASRPVPQDRTGADDAAGRLGACRAALVRERADGSVALVPVAPEPGAALEVHDAPTRCGTVSFALRWHGDRCALLWDVAAADRPVRLVAPGLDPAWSTDAPAGEALLEPGSVTAAGP